MMVFFPLKEPSSHYIYYIPMIQRLSREIPDCSLRKPGACSLAPSKWGTASPPSKSREHVMKNLYGSSQDHRETICFHVLI